MEFPFDVNKILCDEITLVESKDLHGTHHHDNQHHGNQHHGNQHLVTIIDTMGEASSKAQGLRGTITSVVRMRCNVQRIYLMKDAEANGGLGTVIGLLKVGCKHLFLVDGYGQQHECRPLCVLDFFVHESKQRHGYGKVLFDHMLRTEQIDVHQLAIDRPSDKLIGFLAKHYTLDKPVSQVNNFVVFPPFFKDLSPTHDAIGYLSRPLHRKVLVELSSCPNTTYPSRSKQRHTRTSNSLSRQLSVLPQIDVINENDEDSSLFFRKLSKYGSRINHMNNISTRETKVSNFSRHQINQDNDNDNNIHDSMRTGSQYDVTNTRHTLHELPKGRVQLTSLDNPLYGMTSRLVRSCLDRHGNDDDKRTRSNDKNMDGCVSGLPVVSVNRFHSKRHDGFSI